MLRSGQLRLLQDRRGWHYDIGSKLFTVHQSQCFILLRLTLCFNRDANVVTKACTYAWVQAFVVYSNAVLGITGAYVTYLQKFGRVPFPANTLQQ